jgi:hypothetical protein
LTFFTPLFLSNRGVKGVKPKKRRRRGEERANKRIREEEREEFKKG